MPLKRKFAFNLTPIKTTLGIERSDKPKHSSFLHSPFFHPPSPTIDRPVLSPQVEQELRNTLIRVLRDINKPSEQVYEEMFFKRKSKVAEKALNEKTGDKDTDPNHKKNPSFTVSAPQDGGSSKNPPKRYDSGIAVEPSGPEASRTSTTKDESQRHSKAGLSIQPVVSADSSTLATEATRDVEALAGSTGLTSAALTPGDAGKTNPFAQGFSTSDPSLALDLAASPEAQTWMAQEFARRKSQHLVAPAPASSAQPPSSALLRTPTEESTTGSKRRHTIAQTNQDALDRLTAAGAAPVQETKTLQPPELPKRTSWWRRATISRRRSNASLRQSKSAGDTPAKGSAGGRTPDPNAVIPPLPRLDTSKWQEKGADTREEKKEKTKSRSLKDILSSPKSAGPKTPHSAFDTTADDAPRPGSAIIIDEDGQERALSQDEEQKRNSDLRDAVKARMSGSMKSTPTTPALEITDKKFAELGRSGSGSTTHSAVAQSKHSITSPVEEAAETFASKTTETTPKPADVSTIPKPDSELADTTGNSTSAPKSDMPTIPKLSTVTSVPKIETKSATPISPAIEELEDPYASPQPLMQVRTAEVKATPKSSRSSTFLKRFSSLKSGSPKPSPPPRSAKKSPTVGKLVEETEQPRTAKMKQYGKMLETQYEKPRSPYPHAGKEKRDGGPDSGTGGLLTTGKPVRSSSPTPSDLYAL